MDIDSSRLTYIDIFAGAGGLSEGFISTGYKPIAHVEMNSNACQTLKTRAVYYELIRQGKIELYQSYLKRNISKEKLYESVPSHITDSVICEAMSDENMERIFYRINKLMGANNVEQIDLLIGGPPCQAYSQVGRARKCMDDDPRNILYKLYFQTLQRYMPKVFIFENVPGLITAGNGVYLKNMVEDFKSLGYEVERKIIDASDFGVLQRRKRIILVGWKKTLNFHYPDLKKEIGSYTVSDMLSDLPPIQPNESSDQYLDNEISSYLIETGIRKNGDLLTWHIARGHNQRDRDIYIRVIDAWDNERKRLTYSELPAELITHQNTKGFLDRFKVVADNLPASHTMMAHISKDGHHFIHPDRAQARSISVREAARIQSFPDDFFFEGPRTAAFTQIGNAVPPLLAKAFAKALKDQFVELENE